MSLDRKSIAKYGAKIPVARSTGAKRAPPDKPSPPGDAAAQAGPPPAQASAKAGPTAKADPTAKKADARKR
jgi:hypothetical protein